MGQCSAAPICPSPETRYRSDASRSEQLELKVDIKKHFLCSPQLFSHPRDDDFTKSLVDTIFKLRKGISPTFREYADSLRLEQPRDPTVITSKEQARKGLLKSATKIASRMREICRAIITDAVAAQPDSRGRRSAKHSVLRCTDMEELMIFEKDTIPTTDASWMRLRLQFGRLLALEAARSARGQTWRPRNARLRPFADDIELLGAMKRDQFALMVTLVIEPVERGDAGAGKIDEDEASL